jgi:hypothetical protein
MKTKLADRKIILSILMVIFLTTSSNCFAQIKGLLADATKKVKKEIIDSGRTWNTGGRFNLNLAQGSQNNWAAGGDDFSFSINSSLGLYAFYRKDRFSWDNTVDMNYGLLNTTTLGTRKNDDRFDLLSKAGYEIEPKLSLAALFNFHSQFSKGYNYNSDGTKDLLSDFLSPGYVLLGLGLDYKPVGGLSIFVSPITARWIIVNNDTLSAKGTYGVVPGKKVKTEVGAFASINYLHNLSNTIIYKGRLDLFSDYGHNPQNIKVNMTNMFTAKLSKVLSATLALNLIYDDDVKLFGPDRTSPGLQTQSMIGVGLSVKF